MYKSWNHTKWKTKFERIFSVSFHLRKLQKQAYIYYQWMCMNMYWVGQKVCLGLSVRCYGKTLMNYLATQYIHLIRMNGYPIIPRVYLPLNGSSDDNGSFNYTYKGLFYEKIKIRSEYSKSSYFLMSGTSIAMHRIILSTKCYIWSVS